MSTKQVSDEVKNQWFIIKALGTLMWCLAYFLQTLQGLFTPGKSPFCPANYRTLAYCIVWEAAFSWAKVKESKGERAKPTQAELNRTRILFIAWVVFDIPLVLLCLYGGNGTLGEDVNETRLAFIQHLVGWAVIHFALLRGGNPNLYWFMKYLSIPYDIYIVYAMRQVMMGRGPTGALEITLALVKMIADILYLQPMIISWADLLTKSRDQQTWAKGLFTIISSLVTYFADVYLVLWTISNDVTIF